MHVVESLRDKSGGWADMVVITLALALCVWVIGETRRVEETVCDGWPEKSEEMSACRSRHAGDE